MDAARGAFVDGMHVAAGAGVVVVLYASVQAAVLLRKRQSGAEPGA
jgi:hypothetical protein